MFLLGEDKLTEENKELTSSRTAEHMKKQYHIRLLKRDKNRDRRRGMMRRMELEERQQDEENQEV